MEKIKEYLTSFKQQNNLADCKNHVKDELDKISKEFSLVGINIDSDYNFSDNSSHVDLESRYYFSHLRFIYFGLSGDWGKRTLIDKEDYDSIE